MDLISLFEAGTSGCGALKAGSLANALSSTSGTSLVENKRRYNDLGGSYEVSSAS